MSRPSSATYRRPTSASRRAYRRSSSAARTGHRSSGATGVRSYGWQSRFSGLQIQAGKPAGYHAAQQYSTGSGRTSGSGAPARPESAMARYHRGARSSSNPRPSFRNHGDPPKVKTFMRGGGGYAHGTHAYHRSTNSSSSSAGRHYQSPYAQRSRASVTAARAEADRVHAQATAAARSASPARELVPRSSRGVISGNPAAAARSGPGRHRQQASIASSTTAGSATTAGGDGSPVHATNGGASGKKLQRRESSGSYSAANPNAPRSKASSRADSHTSVSGDSDNEEEVKATAAAVAVPDPGSPNPRRTSSAARHVYRPSSGAAATTTAAAAAAVPAASRARPMSAHTAARREQPAAAYVSPYTMANRRSSQSSRASARPQSAGGVRSPYGNGVGGTSGAVVGTHGRHHAHATNQHQHQRHHGAAAWGSRPSSAARSRPTSASRQRSSSSGRAAYVGGASSGASGARPTSAQYRTSSHGYTVSSSGKGYYRNGGTSATAAAAATSGATGAVRTSGVAAASGSGAAAVRAVSHSSHSAAATASAAKPSSSSSSSGGGASGSKAGSSSQRSATGTHAMGATIDRADGMQHIDPEQRERLLRYVSNPNYDGRASTDFYKFGKVLGQGSFAKVRLAWHKLTGVRVAVKSYDKSRLTEPAHWRRTQQEIRLMERLNHPNVIRLLETLESPKRIHIVMEYAGGGNLCKYVKARKRLGEADARGIFVQLLMSVEYLHNCGIIHRDIKLENVLFDENRNMKLVDFGFSVGCRDPTKKLKIFCGTPSYMAPEIVMRQQYAGRPVDVWSLGVLLYAMLCGMFPFVAKSYPELYKKIVRAQLRLPDHMSSAVKDLLRRMLHPDATKRATLSQVRRHAWCAAPVAAMTRQLRIPQEHSVRISEPPEADVFEVTLIKMEEMGFNREAIVQSVRARARNHISVVYYLLLYHYGRSRAAQHSKELYLRCTTVTKHMKLYCGPYSAEVKVLLQEKLKAGKITVVSAPPSATAHERLGLPPPDTSTVDYARPSRTPARPQSAPAHRAVTATATATPTGVATARGASTPTSATQRKGLPPRPASAAPARSSSSAAKATPTSAATATATAPAAKPGAVTAAWGSMQSSGSGSAGGGVGGGGGGGKTTPTAASSGAQKSSMSASSAGSSAGDGAAASKASASSAASTGTADNTTTTASAPSATGSAGEEAQPNFEGVLDLMPSEAK